MNTHSTPPTSIVALLVNIGETDHDFLTKQEAKRALLDPKPRWAITSAPCLIWNWAKRALLGPKPRWAIYEQRVTYSAMDARAWRAIATELDALVEEARAKGSRATGDIQYVVMGRAPLPVFTYLGQRMQRMAGNGDIVFMNQRRGIGGWDRVGPYSALPKDGPDVFTCTPPTAPDGEHGRLVISIRCSSAFPHPEPWIRTFIEGDGGRFLGTFDILYDQDPFKVPLTPENLPALLTHIFTAVALLDKHGWRQEGLVLAVGGPVWVAFWVGMRLNPMVDCRIDIPLYNPKHPRSEEERYFQALASPIYLAPRIDGKARISLFAAEPANQGPLYPGRAVETLRNQLQRGQGAKGPYVIHYEGAMNLREISRNLQQTRPHVLHIWLHGDPRSRLYLENDRGETETLEGDGLVDLIQRSHVEPLIIIVSACYLATLADRLIAFTQCVIAMDDSVRTEAALAFASGFYGEIAQGSWVSDAIAEGMLHADKACHKKEAGRACRAEDCRRGPGEACPRSIDVIRVKYAKDAEEGKYRLLPARHRRRS